LHFDTFFRTYYLSLNYNFVLHSGDKTYTYTRVFSVLFGKPEGKKGKSPLGRSRCRWEDNIRTDLREIGWEGVDWVYLA
jgi:hypothetical protein